MTAFQTKPAKKSGDRAPYRAPTVEVVLHHSETHNMGGTGRDGRGYAPISLS